MRKLKLDELNRPSVDEFSQQSKFPVVLVLDNIRSALNVGSIFRSADGFAMDHIYLCGITARPPHKEINKTALGATETVSWTYSEDLEEQLISLKSQDYILLGVEQTDSSQMLSEFKFDSSKKYALILGNEVEGISDKALKHLDACIEIKQYGTKHSLNVAVCAGIVIWASVQQLQESSTSYSQA